MCDIYTYIQTDTTKVIYNAASRVVNNLVQPSYIAMFIGTHALQ